MTVLVALALAAAGIAVDPLTAALERYEAVQTYQVTLKSEGRGSEEVIRYYFRKPGFVKMEFIKPYRGTVLLFNPYTNRVKVVPFGFLMLSFTLDPGSRFLKSSGGHQVDKSDMGALLQSVRALAVQGETDVLGEEMVGDRAALPVHVRGTGDFTVHGVNAYKLWLDRESSMPLRAMSFDVQDRLIEDVLMDDLTINVIFGEDLFD